MSVLQTIDLKKYYGTEPNITRALDGVNFWTYAGYYGLLCRTDRKGEHRMEWGNISS